MRETQRLTLALVIVILFYSLVNMALSIIRGSDTWTLLFIVLATGALWYVMSEILWPE